MLHTTHKIAIPLLDVNPKETKISIWEERLPIAKFKKPLLCPPEECVNNTGNRHSVEYYMALKINQLEWHE